jgi:glycosyltransferase involved in cell wall biosynthesis
MKVCGFSFIRNAVKFDYPIVEAIRSILPVCDAVIVAVGNSDDGTLQLIKNIDPKVRVVETIWDENLRKGGQAFAVETDKAFQAIPAEFDWAFYIQGDEVVHEKYLPVIRQAMLNNLGDSRVEGLLFNYLHFFGSYDFIGQKYSWYRREVRVVRNRKDIFSYRDAQGFRKKPNTKLRVRLIDAYIYHYGWTRDPDALQKKVESSARYYHDDGWLKKFFTREATYEYSEKQEPIGPFKGTHPAVMEQRIQRKNWKFEPDRSLRYGSAKDRVKRVIGNLTGWYPGEYKNYRRLR